MAKIILNLGWNVEKAVPEHQCHSEARVRKRRPKAAYRLPLHDQTPA